MIKIYLSERNLQVLLSKVERFNAGDETECAIVKHNNHMDPYNMTCDDADVMIVAVPDRLYYASRDPGVMCPLDVRKIRFVPRDIGMWRGIFNFPPKLLPLPDFIEFETAHDVVEFFNTHKVRFDDEANPFQLIYVGNLQYDVVQFSKLGVIHATKVQSEKILNEVRRHVLHA